MAEAKSVSEKITAVSLTKRKVEIRAGKASKITALTAYDFTLAKLLDSSGVDLILVGDSLSSVFQGQPTTLAVTMDQMVYHCRCVTQAVSRALVVGDMPFLSYQISPEEALRNAGRLVKEAGVSAVKLEGGQAISLAIKKITEAEIPVLGHVGLTPQSYLRMGGYKVQGRENAKNSESPEAGSREAVIRDALAVQEAGAFAIVLEGIPSELAAELTSKLEIPTIGIGAGPECDGQILVTADMLGMTAGEVPKFVKCYAKLGEDIKSAVESFSAEVKRGIYPDESHEYRSLKRIV